MSKKRASYRREIWPRNSSAAAGPPDYVIGIDPGMQGAAVILYVGRAEHGWLNVMRVVPFGELQSPGGSGLCAPVGVIAALRPYLHPRTLHVLWAIEAADGRPGHSERSTRQTGYGAGWVSALPFIGVGSHTFWNPRPLDWHRMLPDELRIMYAGEPKAAALAWIRQLYGPTEVAQWSREGVLPRAAQDGILDAWAIAHAGVVAWWARHHAKKSPQAGEA